MRDKLIGFILCISLIASSIVAVFLCNDQEYYHQYKIEKTIQQITSLDYVDEKWLSESTTDNDYHLNDYFFINMAGDMFSDVPLCCYALKDNQLVLTKQKPVDSVESDFKYKLSIRPYVIEDDDSNSENSIISFVDYNYLTTNKRLCLAIPQKDYSLTEIKKDLSYFEKCVYSSDYDSKKYGYYNLINESNFVDYFLLYELAYSGYCSEDSFTLFMDKNSRYCLVPSEFDGSGKSDTDFYHNMLASTWFSMLLKSRTFTSDILDEYNYYRKTLFSENYIHSELDEIVNFMLSSNTVNEQALMNERDELELYLLNRLNWLDDNIDSLKQYSALSAVKEYRLTPY